jgi:MFS family permease
MFFTIAAPTASKFGTELRMSAVESAVAVTIWELSAAFGLFLFGPLSESESRPVQRFSRVPLTETESGVYGRKKVLLSSTIICLAFHNACGFATAAGELIFFRFVAGFGGASSMCVGGAIIADLYKPPDRASAQAVYNLAFALGLGLGPLFGCVIAAYTTWRWVFWGSSIAGLTIVACRPCCITPSEGSRS